MNQSFAANARRFAGIAARVLGWRPHDFWDTTPAELALALATPSPDGTPPSRSEIESMMEQERNGR